MSKGPISAKAKREAAPIEVLPFRLVRKYGEPVLYGSAGDVRSAINKDLDNLIELGASWGAALNRADIEESRTRLVPFTAGHLQIEFEFDHHTGTKYQVSVTDRRVP